MRHHTWKSAAPAALILLSTVVLAGCGDDEGAMPGMNHATPSATPSSATAQAGAFNDADVAFATQMIPHHQQAVQMASMAGYQATTPEVKQLGAAIKAAQDPEIKLMTGWLTQWGKPVPSPEHGDHGGHDEMPGMMTEDELSELGKQKGSMFDRMWVLMMIKHHQGAVTMAKTEQTAGKDPAAIALAKKIETDQNREIATMKRLLGQLPTS
ncbi:DUF305 domain-containing protein [Kribbella sp. NPDC023972]|uniref:DUF305 domain-containing protein n=1 Tax=Kribbella sp. NPDC023972 TaxID=3154795 RepID=UPI0033FD9A3A